MAKGLRACPTCPDCGSKKFKVVDNNSGRGSSTAEPIVIIECICCARKIAI